MDFSDLNLKTNFKEDLRGDAESPKDMLAAISRLKKEIQKTIDPSIKVSYLGQLGGHLRTLGKLDEALKVFDKALELIDQHSLKKNLEIVNRIRRAHVLHWKKEFSQSTPLFDDLVKECEEDQSIRLYLDFAYQHRGKNYFDQQMYKKALEDFNKALELRNKKGEASLIKSTLQAIKATKAKF